MAPAPHVDGDPFWGSARSRRPGASARAPHEGLPEASGLHHGRMRRPMSAAFSSRSTRCSRASTPRWWCALSVW